MSPYEQIQAVLQELDTLSADIRAEALVSQIEGYPGKGQVVIANDGRFYREYRSDLYRTLHMEDQWRQELLQLHLSRTGLYDLLPEGLFHQPVHTHAVRSALDMAAMSRVDKKKEAEVRKFFQPLENGFFTQRVCVEQEEAALLSGGDDGALAQFLFTFWSLPAGLNRQSAALLVQLIPYAHRINSDLGLMQQCLHILLQEEVRITLAAPSICTAPAAQGLGALELGNDMVCGSTFWEDHTCLQYHIGPLVHAGPAAYLEGGERALLIDVFNSYFAPAEASIDMHIHIDQSMALMAFTEEAAPILGYTSVL